VTTFSFPDKGSRVLREWNERRQIERAAVARSAAPRQRNFAGAAINRLTASLETWSGAINSDLDNGLAILRSRARTLCANNEFGRRFLSLVSANVVGAAGPTLQVRALTQQGTLDKPANDAIEVAWKTWCGVADISGRMSLTRLLQVLVKGVARDGEGLVRIVRDPSLPFGIQLQLLEADRLDESFNAVLRGAGRVRQGVEFDSLGRPVAYHLLTTHPGENYNANQRIVQRVPVKDLFHVFLPERAEQCRGYTWLHAILLRSHMLHGFEEAAVVAARVGASKMGVWTRDPEADPESAKQLGDAGADASGNLQMQAEPGEFIEAPSGYKLDSWNPEYPHANFESFLKACVRGLAVGLNVATHNLSGDMTEVNYSSARIAELAEREIWMELQEWLISSLLLPLYREWLASALLRGEIVFADSGKSLPVDKLQKFATAARFQARRWAWVDPLKDAQASALLIENGLASRTSIAASQGRELEDIVDELAQEEALFKAAGLDIAEKPAAPTQQQTTDSEDPSKETA
jgi:lambda family phage portal protein